MRGVQTKAAEGGIWTAVGVYEALGDTECSVSEANGLRVGMLGCWKLTVRCKSAAGVFAVELCDLIELIRFSKPPIHDPPLLWLRLRPLSVLGGKDETV